MSAPTAPRLAFVDLPRGDFSAAGRLALIPAAGGETSYPEAGSRHIDGPEYSADGDWIYLNTEEFGVRPGHAQLARVPADGGDARAVGRLRHRRLVPAPLARRRPATYISFPTGTLGHPADLEVEIRVVDDRRLDRRRSG